MGKNRANKALKLKTSPKRTSFKALSFKSKDVAEVRGLALYLADKFNDQDSLNFYLKCAWHLSGQFLVELAERSPSRYYFYAVARREMN